MKSIHKGLRRDFFCFGDAGAFCCQLNVIEQKAKRDKVEFAGRQRASLLDPSLPCSYLCGLLAEGLARKWTDAFFVGHHWLCCFIVHHLIYGALGADFHQLTEIHICS